jgi:hypothetical protein
MNNMLYKIIPSSSHLEIRFNNDDTQCQFHNFHRSEHVTLFNMPKCASTSLNDYFKFLCQQPIQGHKTFLFLREPYGRLKSAFRMKCLNELAPNNFSSTIKKYHEFLKGKPIPYAHYNDMIHVIPQLSFIDSVDIEFDYMGRVENLQHSIDQLNTALNIKKYKVKHMNKNTLDKKHNKQFEKEYQKHMKENKTFYTNFLEKDMRLYDIQN